MRYRVTARIKWVSPLVMVALALALAAMVPRPWLLPLAPPLLFVLYKLRPRSGP